MMRQSFAVLAFLVVCGLQMGGCVPDQVEEDPADPSTARFGGKKVLAFYYQWYGAPSGPTGKWESWFPLRNTDPEFPGTRFTPELGWYDSLDKNVVAKHVSWAKKAGIDAFIASWWAPDKRSDTAVLQLLDECGKQGIFATVYVETCGDKSDLILRLNHIIDRYGTHDAFLEVRGRPVIFLWAQVMRKFSAPEFAEIFRQVRSSGREAFFVGDGADALAFFDVFDGMHAYHWGKMPIDDAQEIIRTAAKRAKEKNILWCGTAFPGGALFDGHDVYEPFEHEIKRENGAHYEETWRLAMRNEPDWVTITSWNEWHEHTSIEPASEYGNRYLDITSRFSSEFKGRP